MTPKSAEEVASEIFLNTIDAAHNAPHLSPTDIRAVGIIAQALRSAQREALLELAIIINEVSRERFRDSYAALSWAEVEARALASSDEEKKP